MPICSAKLLRVGDFRARYAGTVGGDGDGVSTESEMGCLRNDRAVDAAAERYGRFAEAVQYFEEPVAFSG